MSAIIKNFGYGRYRAGEADLIYSRKYGPPLPPLVFCHQHGVNVDGVMLGTFNGEVFYDRLFRELAEDYTVLVGDIGGPSEWGNQNSRNAVTDARNYLSSEYGATGKLGLIGASMGGATVFGWAKATGAPSTRFVAGIEPLLDINSLRYYPYPTPPNPPAPPVPPYPPTGTYNNLINAAYGGDFANPVHGVEYSPYLYRASYPASTIPTRIWTTPDDDVVLNEYADGLVASQPDIERTVITRPGGGGYGHSLEALAVAVPDVVEWCRKFA